MKKRILYIAMLALWGLTVKGQSLADADAMYKQFMFMRADTSYTKEQIIHTVERLKSLRAKRQEKASAEHYNDF